MTNASPECGSSIWLLPKCRSVNLMNFQIQLTKRQGIVPITRDYIAREEARLRGLELGKRPRLQLAGE